jgi:hypothetical protein
MRLQQIDAIGLEPAKRLVDLARRRVLVAPVDLGHQEGALTIAVTERLAHADLALPVVVVPAVGES